MVTTHEQLLCASGRIRQSAHGADGEQKAPGVSFWTEQTMRRETNMYLLLSMYKWHQFLLKRESTPSQR